MKFGILAGQTGVKIVQRVNSSLQCFYCEASDAHTAAGRRRARPRVGNRTRPRCLSAALSHADASNFPVLPFHPHPRARAELGRAESPPSAAPATARHPASIRRARSRADSPSTHSDHPRARPSPYPGRIELRPPSAIAVLVKLHPELRPSRRRPPSGLPSRKTNPR